MAKSVKRNYIKNHGIILTLCVVAFLVRMISGEFNWAFNVILLAVSIGVLSITWEFLYFIDIRLNGVLPYERNIPLRIVVQILIGIGFSLLTRWLLRWGEPFLPVKLDSLFLLSTWVLYVLGGLIMNGIFLISAFMDQWKNSLIRAERLEKEKSQVQFDNLKNQLNPHFLFNALTTLNSLIFDNPELASQYLHHLSKVFRYMLQHKETSLVSLSTELDFIRNKVFLLETRFADAVNIQFNIEKSQLDKIIVPVTLQLLLENAIKHNIIDIAKPLTIQIRTEGDYLLVTNNLQVRNRVESSNKQGLENLKSLYQYLSDKPVLVNQTEKEFIVKIPLL